MSDLAALLPLVGIALIFWLLVVRPNQRRQQQQRAVQNELAAGDRVLLTSGLYGVIAGVDADTVELEISPGVLVTVARQAVMRPVPTPLDKADPADPVTPDEGTD